MFEIVHNYAFQFKLIKENIKTYQTSNPDYNLQMKVFSRTSLGLNA